MYKRQVWFFDRSERQSDREAAEKRSLHELEITGQRIDADREINRERTNQQTLELCLEYISGQLINLHQGVVASPIQIAIIRARVLEALDSLAKDHPRRDQVLRLLLETGLLTVSPTGFDPLLQAIEIKGLDLPRANLRNICFAKSYLSVSNFNDAQLFSANFENTILNKVSFAGSELSGATFERASLTKVSFARANLENALFSFTEPDEVVFTKANLRCAKFISTKLDGNELSQANLEKVDMTSASLKGVNLASTNLTWAILRYADLSDSDLLGADLDNAELDYVKLRGAKIDNSTKLIKKWRDVWELQSGYAARSTVSLDDGDREAESSLLDLLELMPSESNQNTTQRYRGADLTRADLSDLSLRYMDLTEARLEDSWLRRTNLTGTDLSGASLKNCDLSEAILDGAKLTNCDLSGAILTLTQLQSAKDVPYAACLLYTSRCV